jgi:hypothetical protein
MSLPKEAASGKAWGWILRIPHRVIHTYSHLADIDALLSISWNLD